MKEKKKARLTFRGILEDETLDAKVPSAIIDGANLLPRSSIQNTAFAHQIMG